MTKEELLKKIDELNPEELLIITEYVNYLTSWNKQVREGIISEKDAENYMHGEEFMRMRQAEKKREECR